MKKMKAQLRNKNEELEYLKVNQQFLSEDKEKANPNPVVEITPLSMSGGSMQEFLISKSSQQSPTKIEPNLESTEEQDDVSSKISPIRNVSPYEEEQKIYDIFYQSKEKPPKEEENHEEYDISKFIFLISLIEFINILK
jgi:hypothetical protein